MVLTCDDGDLAFQAEQVEDVSVPWLRKEHHGWLSLECGCSRMSLSMSMNSGLLWYAMLRKAGD